MPNTLSLTRAVRLRLLCLLSSSFLTVFSLSAQSVTGVWKGKINNTRVELKLVKSGDSLVGTAYYFSSKNAFKRYSVKGYFDPQTNEVIWWDEALIEEREGRSLLKNNAHDPLLHVADFNCPGETEMRLDGNSNQRDDKDSDLMPLHLQKEHGSQFNDDWDWVIENYTLGANHPDIIDSINRLQGRPYFPEELAVNTKPITAPGTKPAPVPEPKPEIKPVPEAEKTPLTVPALAEEKFRSRRNILQTVIPVTAATIELRFYDNAQVDGDSIALFLNDKLIFKNIRLTDKAYTIQLNASELQDDNELVMVAENLGSIPPNTSFMVAIVGDKRYEARLYANEKSSALIRLVKPSQK